MYVAANYASTVSYVASHMLKSYHPCRGGFEGVFEQVSN